MKFKPIPPSIPFASTIFLYICSQSLHGSLCRLTVDAEKLLAGYARDEAHPAFHATTATQLSMPIRYISASPAYRISGT
jgi:hypothetical protein